MNTVGISSSAVVSMKFETKLCLKIQQNNFFVVTSLNGNLSLAAKLLSTFDLPC